MENNHPPGPTPEQLALQRASLNLQKSQAGINAGCLGCAVAVVGIALVPVVFIVVGLIWVSITHGH